MPVCKEELVQRYYFSCSRHQDTLVSNHSMLNRITALRNKTRARLVEHRDRMGVITLPFVSFNEFT